MVEGDTATVRGSGAGSDPSVDVTEPVVDGAGEPEVTVTSGFRTLLPYARSERARFTFAALLGFGSAVLELAPFWLIYLAVQDVVDGTGSTGSYTTLALVAAACVVGRFVLAGLGLYVSHLAAYQVLYRLRLAIADRLGRLPLGFFTRKRSGEIQQVMSADVERLELFLAHALPDVGASVGAWALMSAWLLAVDWRLFLAAFVVVPLAFPMLSIAMRSSSREMGEYHASGARMNGAITEYVRGMPVVKVFNRAGSVEGETARTIDDYTRLVTGYSRRFLPFGTLFFVLLGAGVLVVVPVGLWLYLSNRIDVTTLLFFYVVGIGYAIPLTRLLYIFFGLQHVTFGGNTVRDLLTAAELPDATEPVTPADSSVEFEHVSFGYDGARVLDDVSFTASAGQVTALVGPSGAGKTTIARLIPRFWDVDEGTVRIGGADVRSFPFEQLMATVSFVFQETFLFDDTVGANIRVGRPDAPDAEVEAAARAAQAHDFITRLPLGYRTTIGEHGARLSGGGRQRIAIARAILKDAPVVVLDEATAFADPENEAALQDALDALVADRTLLLVAHRLSTIAGADQILVVDRGRIVEHGTHAALLAVGGLYAQLWDDYTTAETIAPGAGSVGALS